MNFLQKCVNSNNSIFNNEQLSNSLSEFGLRPVDWILIKNSSTLIKIQNKEEPSFCFLGKIKKTNGKTKWNNIQLVSL